MSPRPAQFSFPTYPASALVVHWGANEGDPIAGEAEVAPGDSYRLQRGAEPRQLAMRDGPDGPEVADGSQVGRPGERLALELCHSLMAPDGHLIEILLLRLESKDGTTRHFMPLAQLQQRNEYTLVSTDRDCAPKRFADIAAVRFITGTHLTMANGAQRAVEDLQVGDMLLTRHHGPQPVRWIGQHVLRAVGTLAPIRIAEGTLNVARDLRLFPHHRLFIWQRSDELGTGRSELLMKATHLVNGNTVTREEGGHIETYQILFDAHEIIYAEGLAVESLLVTPQTSAGLPEGIDKTQAKIDQRDAAEIEVDGLVAGEDVVEQLTRASEGRLKGE